MDAQLRYMQMGADLIAVIDRGATLDLGELHEQIANDGLFQWLHEKEPEIDQSLYLAEDRAAMLKFFKRRGSVADARRKYRIEENGLCLLVAYCFEGLEHACRENSGPGALSVAQVDQPRKVETIICDRGNGEKLATLRDTALFPPLNSAVEIGEPDRAAVVRSVKTRLGPSYVSITVEVEVESNGAAA